MKRIVSVILMMTLALCLVAAAYAEGDVKIKSVSPADKKVVLAPSATWQAEVNIKPEDATNKTLEWKSSDEKVATVDENGVITGVKKGNCKITATTTDGSKKKAAITVSVKNYDLVITKPGITKTDFETTDDYAEYEVGFMGNVKRTIVKRTVTFKGGVVESAGDHAVRPVKAGEGTVESVSKENKKTTGKEKHSVYVSQSAIVVENDAELKRLDAKTFNGHTYQLFYSGRKWSEAKEFCEKAVGHLATIANESEQVFIQDYIGRAVNGSYWIGMTNGNNKVLQWVTGEKVEYQKWMDANPDYDGTNSGVRIASGNYLQPDGWKMDRGTWDDTPDDWYLILGFICEWDEERDGL